ncbi:hypothetical protein BLOT_014263 [Blomia tropicalis]|nr:hypothetical protein BLOT_014263 [Blomia tropicalis]
MDGEFGWKSGRILIEETFYLQRTNIWHFHQQGDDGNCSISNHLTNSNTLLNVHLRPNRSNSLRAKNAKSQS